MCRAECRRLYDQQNLEYVREQRKRLQLKRDYGITTDEYNDLLDKYKKSCAICGNTKNLKVDHNHITGKVRGILCNKCNLGIGLFKDNHLLLIEAALYLQTLDDKNQ